MKCRLDVNSYVFRNIEQTVGDTGKIDINTGTARVTQSFGNKNLAIIKNLNQRFGTKVISYFAARDNDLPGIIEVKLTDKLYDHYLKKYGPKEVITEATIPEVVNIPANQVQFSLKSIDILSSDKAKQVFEKGKKNGWDLNKILTELQVPKEQGFIILDKYKGKVSEQEFIKSIFPDTKVNQVVYHTTPNKFKQFDKKFLQKGIGNTTEGVGFYFSNREDSYQEYKGIVNIQNEITKDNEARELSINNLEKYKSELETYLKNTLGLELNLDNKEYIDDNELPLKVYEDYNTYKKVADTYFNLKNSLESQGINESLNEDGISYEEDILSRVENSEANLLNVILNIKNPKIFNKRQFLKDNSTLENNDGTITNLNIKDVSIKTPNGFVKKVKTNEKDTQYVTFEPEQIHILTEEEQAKIYNEDTLREEIITSLLADNSFVVEINTAKDNNISQVFSNGKHTVLDNNYQPLAFFDTKKEADDYIDNYDTSKPTSHYKNMTVLGGTNYTENEISTPLITPSIKGHAQFSTDNGIGWFRSDDKFVKTGENIVQLPEENWVPRFEGYTSKTRRVLEVQSDWGQKQRKSSESDINVKYDIQQIINDLQKSGDLKIDCN